METMNAPNTVKSYQYFKVAPSLGEVVLVKHWSSQWIRGIIRDFHTDANGDPINFQV